MIQMQTVALILTFQATVPKYEAFFYLYQMQVSVLKTQIDVSVIQKKNKQKIQDYLWELLYASSAQFGQQAYNNNGHIQVLTETVL